MAFNYDWDIDAFARILLPKKYRNTVFVAWIRLLTSATKWVRDRVFDYYLKTVNHTVYSGVATYDKGDFVKYGYEVYECLEDSTSGIAPTNAAYWRLQQNNWIGALERSKVKQGKISLEFYLNKLFLLSFNYPISTNDIYIETQSETIVQIYSSDTEEYSSVITDTQENTIYYVSDTFSTYSQTSMIIYVPAATYTTLGSTDSERSAVITGLIDHYIPAGIIYEVTDY